MTVENIRAALGNLDALKGDIEARKTVQFLVENSKTVEAQD